MSSNKRERLMKRIEYHLRNTSRQLIKIDTEEEALQYLTHSFCSELHCDFVAVIFNEGGQFLPKAWSGSLTSLASAFPLHADECSSKLQYQSITDQTADLPEVCLLSETLQSAGAETWFTVPLKDDIQHFGFCIVAFLSHVPLLDMEISFEEFGKDIAVAIAVARQKELQLKKIEGFGWISKNLSLDVPLEKHVYEVTSKAGIETNAGFSCVYLYNEAENCFVLQPPSYGEMRRPYKIMVEDKYVLKEHFPFFETIGGEQFTAPIVIDMKPIGVLHVEKKCEGVFTEADAKSLEMIANHLATILDNARLYNGEKEHKQRLHLLLDYQQALLKETVDDNNFEGITTMLGSLFQDTVFIFDRFMQPIAFNDENGGRIAEHLSDLAREERKQQRITDTFHINDPNNSENCFSFWIINGGGNFLGYLAVRRTSGGMDEFDQLTVDLARNICSIQFIKQKLVLDTKEQMKDSFISKLLIEKIEDRDNILQYANLYQWNLFKQHRVAVLSISLDEKELKKGNLLEQQAKKSLIWDLIKTRLPELGTGIFAVSHNDEQILIVPIDEQKKESDIFWETVFYSIQKWINSSPIGCRILLGIGGITKHLEDYYISYQQAIQALNILDSRFRKKGYALFEDLGSYAILHHLNHSTAVDLFIKKQIGPLLEYSEGKNIDLYNTLHVFLQNNGNVKSAAKELFIHRSSLLYRLEKIESLISVDLNHAEVRFNLMMALKLYDMHGEVVG
ncbi:helix-turn-helix domain-containing protein [Bacillus cereus]|uniref:helix-turn-helix domain-containing protein n=1 Tax=Bacillus cereus TaxID=1396 RepID=UPI0025711529|nr:helix-turn-helix domain-containing protein [Bacillus cereus]MDM5463030.1 helix-turn-helix domain-containing protein [Bacillus cereus]WJE18155.1 helix-turn-helix domain-containing protein [Bacillus cereus]